MKYFEITQFYNYEVDLQCARYVNLHQESTSSYVFMAKLQIIITASPDIEIFLISVLCYQHALQWVYFSDKSVIYGYFDIILSAASCQKRLKPTLRSFLSSYNDPKLLILLYIVS